MKFTELLNSGEIGIGDIVRLKSKDKEYYDIVIKIKDILQFPEKSFKSLIFACKPDIDKVHFDKYELAQTDGYFDVHYKVKTVFKDNLNSKYSIGKDYNLDDESYENSPIENIAKSIKQIDTDVQDRLSELANEYDAEIIFDNKQIHLNNSKNTVTCNYCFKLKAKESE